ncbi:hypothetical protein ABAC460_01635 [Asticcacaulis sp. AC460]|uniref:hypothetical protein n=1 Tax=Asticcacaulis sp. AC460 TaxID=1282360 RepID=UPI0003C40868|nr:hypothetical protein [Asticcacaulis sp. AC460]ESQ92978.1 hypothetical protein ABAC460_01635 [Asticcacaulis sp. AC460]
MRPTFVRNFAAGLFGVSLCILPLSPATAQTPPAEVSEASLTLSREVLENLRYFDLMLIGMRNGFEGNDDYRGLSETEQKRFFALAVEEMEIRRVAIIDVMAKGNINRLTAEEWEQAAQFSRIKYVQDLVLAGVNPSGPRPDPATMTPSESALFSRLVPQPFIARLFSKEQIEPAESLVLEAGNAALARFQAQ